VQYYFSHMNANLAGLEILRTETPIRITSCVSTMKLNCEKMLLALMKPPSALRACP